MQESRNESNQLAIDFNHASADQYPRITSTVKNEFKLEAAGEKVSGLDVVFQNFKEGESAVSLEWDNWSGYSVCAKTESSIPFARSIAKFINREFGNT